MKIGQVLHKLPDCPFCKNKPVIVKIFRSPYKQINYIRCETEGCSNRIMNTREWVTKCKFYIGKPAKLV